MFYYDGLRHVLYRFLPLVILAEMKHNFRRHSAIREWDVQAFRREEIDSNVLKSALLHRHVLNVRNSCWHIRWGRAETFACNGRCCRPGIAEISRYSRVGRGPFGRRRTRNFTDSQFPIGGRTKVYSVGYFTVKSACVFCS